MAVTFIQQPQKFTPSDNNVQWVFSSDQTGQPNFEYKIELLINSVVVYVGKVFPIQGAVAYFNAVEVLRGIVPGPTINSSPAVALNDPSELSWLNDSQREVSLKVTERYGSPIADKAHEVSATIKVWKASISESNWIDFDYETHLVLDTTRLFLTNFPRHRKYYVTPNQNNYLSIILDGGNYNLMYTTFDDADDFALNVINGVSFINVGMAHLVVVNGSSLEQFLNVWVQELPTNRITETFTFHILNACSEHRTVFFLNKLGGVDSWTFTARKQQDATFERSEFKKKLGRLVDGEYVYDRFDGRIQNFHNATTDREVLDSDWLFPDVHAWLVSELLESPLVWTEDQDGNKTRWVVTNAQSSKGQDRTDVWRQLSLELKPTLQSYSVTL